jgi:ankyrin repeat protein
LRPSVVGAVGMSGVGALAAVILASLLGAVAPPDAPVADAAQRGDVESVRSLLRRGEDVNAAQGDGMTALHWAAERGDVALCEVVLYAGARVDVGTRIGSYTPLHIASRNGHAAVARLLLEAGADPNATITTSGAAALHLAAASGAESIVGALLASGAVVDAREAAWGQTPLVFAAASNQVGVIHLLVDAGADISLTANPIDVPDRAEADRTAERRLTELLNEFREREGGGTDWRPTPSQVQAAIDASRRIQRRWPDVPRLQADEAGEGGEGEEPADSVATAEEPPVEKKGEVSADSAVADRADSTGTAEEDSRSIEDGEQVGEGAGPDDSSEDSEPRPLSYPELVQSWGGLTPLLHAVRQGHMDAAEALLDRGADVDQPSAGDGTTPLLMATLNGQFDLALTLLQRGADPNRTGVAGVGPLFAVLERQWAPRASYAHPIEHAQQRATHLEVLEALLEAGADPNVRLTSHLWFMEYTFAVLRGSGINLKGATPFWRAAYALDVDAMRLLKAHGADPNIPTMKPPQRRRRPDPAEEEQESEEQEEPDPDVPEKPAPQEPGALETSADSVGSQTYGGPTKANAEGESAEQEARRPEGGEDEDHSGVPPVPVGGPAIYPIHAASGVGYGQSFAGNAHRHVPDNWLAAVKFLVEECGAEVDVRDANAYTALHHAASRGDNALVLYLVERGADVTVVSRKGQTTADMANGPIQRVPPYPETVALLERLGSRNNHACTSC